MLAVMVVAGGLAMAACGSGEKGVDEQQVDQPTAVPPVAAATCADPIPNGCVRSDLWNTTPGVTCPAGYIEYSNYESCVRCNTPTMVLTECTGTLACAEPTPRNTLCAGKTGWQYDPKVCSSINCDQCTGAYAGMSLCNGQCVKLQTDAKNCGMCGNTCPASGGGLPATCSGGLCRVCTVGYAGSYSCTSLLPTCASCPGNSCANLNTDVNNCGACGRVCAAPGGGRAAACSSGVCRSCTVGGYGGAWTCNF